MTTHRFKSTIRRRAIVAAARLRRIRQRRPVLAHAIGLAIVSPIFFALVSAMSFSSAPAFVESGFALADLAHTYRAKQSPSGPASQMIVVDDPSWHAEIGRANGRVPAAVPADLVARIVDQARAYQVPLLVVDIDVTVAHPEPEERSLAAALDAWARDPQAGVIVLARRPVCPLNDPKCITVQNPYDGIVSRSANIFWASPFVELDHRGTLRWVDLRPSNNFNITALAAVLAKGIERAEHPAELVRERATRLKRCYATRQSAKSCLGLDHSGIGNRLLIPFDTAMPKVGDLEDAGRHSFVGIVSIRSADAFINRPSLAYTPSLPLFVGVTHQNSGDRFNTPIGDQNGVSFVAATSMHWARNGFPTEPSRTLSLFVALCWGGFVGAGIGTTVHLRKVLLQYSTGRRRKLIAILIEPFTILPIVVMIANATFFLGLAQFPPSNFDWRVLSIVGILISIVAIMKAIRDTIKETR